MKIIRWASGVKLKDQLSSAQLRQSRGKHIKRLGGGDHLKICRRGQSIFWPPKSVIFFRSKLLLDNWNFTSLRMKDLCQKWKVKLNFWGAYRPSGTGTVECLEIIDVRCKRKQFDGLTWLTLTPPDFTTGLCHWDKGWKWRYGMVWYGIVEFNVPLLTV